MVGLTEGSVETGGASGIVILRYATSQGTPTIGAGLTSSTTTDGSDTIITFTAGTDTITLINNRRNQWHIMHS